MTDRPGPDQHDEPATTAGTGWKLSVAVLVLALAAVLSITYQDALQDRARVQRRVHDAAAALALQLEHQLAENGKSLLRMAERWEQRGGTPRGEWEVDAAAILRDMSGFTSLARLSASGDSWVVTEPDYAPPRWDADRLLAEFARGEARARVVSLPSGEGASVLVYVQPLRDRGGDPDGLLAAEMDEQEQWAAAVSWGRAEGNLDVSVVREGREVFRTGPALEVGRPWVGAATLPVGRTLWQVRVRPTAQLLATWRSPRPVLMLSTGCLSAVLLAMCCHMALTARSRAQEQSRLNRQLVELNRSLDEQVDRRTSELDQSRRAAVEIALDAEAARLQAEESSQRVRAVVNTAADGIFTMDSRGKIESFNPAAERLFGYTAEEAVGLDLWELIPHVAGDVTEEDEGEQSMVGMDHASEGRRKDGTVFPLELTLSRMRLSGRRMFTAIVRDITMRRHAENELRRLNEDLAGANHELQQFVYSVSHDLKSPLLTIQGYVNRLSTALEGSGDETLRDYAGRVLRAAGRMQRNIEDLLKLSRAGKLSGELSTIDVKQIVDDVVRDLEAQVEAAGATVVVQGDLPPAVADPTRMSEVFQNLIGNAIKYGCEGQSRRIEVTGKVEGSRVVYAVADDGPGIPPQFHEKIFGLFQRLNTTKTEGSGVGLALVKRVVEVHGGKVRVESPRADTGRGSRFTVELPATAAVPGAVPGALRKAG